MTVLDVNDNRPAFTSSVYYVNVTESEQPQAAVFTVQATDRDEGDRLFYSLYAFSDQQSKSRFTIDSVSGKLLCNWRYTQFLSNFRVDHSSLLYATNTALPVYGYCI